MNDYQTIKNVMILFCFCTGIGMSWYFYFYAKNYAKKLEASRKSIAVLDHCLESFVRLHKDMVDDLTAEKDQACSDLAVVDKKASEMEDDLSWLATHIGHDMLPVLFSNFDNEKAWTILAHHGKKKAEVEMPHLLKF